MYIFAFFFIGKSLQLGYRAVIFQGRLSTSWKNQLSMFDSGEANVTTTKYMAPLLGKRKKEDEKERGTRNTPPFTSPLVLIALRLSVVMTQTAADIPIMMMLCSMPACATTHDSRRKSITPHILSRHGMRTPWIHPSFIPVCPC